MYGYWPKSHDVVMKKLKVGIAGFGIVGKRRKECVDKNQNLQLIAVCDKNFSGSGVDKDGLKYFNNYQDLLNLGLDIIIVCMTNDMASEVVIAGLNSGAHIFCEKPPGRNMQDIKDVITASRRNPELKLMYGFNHRYHYSVIDALRISKSGELGNIINLRGVYGKSKLITFNQTDWRTKRTIAGGGVLLDQGIHMVDLMRLFAGEFQEVHSFISNRYWGLDVEDNAYSIMKSESGIIGVLHSSATEWRHRFNLEINFERGSLILGGLLSGTKSYGSETLKIVWSDADNDYGDPKEQTTLYNKDDSWALELNKFIGMIINNKALDSGSVFDAFQTMKLVHKIYYADLSWRDKYSIPNPDVE